MVRSRSILFKVLLLIYLAVVAWACFGRFDNMPSIDTGIFGIPKDKLIHAFMFFPFPILVRKASGIVTENLRQSLFAASAVLAFGMLIAYGTEFIQGLTGYRSKDMTDFAADTIGLTAGTITALIINLRKKEK